MTTPTPFVLNLARRACAVVVWAALLAAMSTGTLSPSAAWAGDDEDNSGSGNADDRDDDDEDEDDDRSGPSRDNGGSYDDGDDDGRGSRQAGDGRPGRSGRVPRDIAVYYPDDWVERIVGGRYELLDDQSRLVIRRTATSEDFSRMEALR